MFQIARRSFFVLSLLSFMSLMIFGQKFDYPKPKKVEQVDDYSGTKVADPYRWMEEYSADTNAWIQAQNKVTDAYLSQISERNIIKDRLTKLWNYEKYSSPVKHGNNYFYSKNDGLQNQSVMYIAKSIDDPGKVFLDPNKLSNDGTVALSGMAFTDDGKLVAIGTAAAGSDMTEWRVMEVETGKYLDDKLEKRRQGISGWTNDNSGFFYSAFPKPNENTSLKDQNFYQKLYYHKLGTPTSQDVLIYERPDNKEYFVGGNVTDDGHYLIITVNQGTRPQNMVYYKDLQTKDSKVMPIVENLNNDYSFIDNIGTTFYFSTDLDATRKRVIAVDIANGNKITEIIPQAAETLGNVSLLNNQLVTNYLKDAYTQIRIYDLKGKFVRNVQLPGIGSAGGFGGKREDTETFYSYSSYNAPPTIFRYDMKTGKSTVFRQAKVDFNPADYEVKQVFYPSKDGTKIPMFLFYKKGIKLDGTNPTILYGYGGFNIPQTPGFSVSRLVWTQMGGVYAIANLRGGSEYGEKWHEDGMKLKKQNVFDDFAWAAKYLIAQKYTQPSKLAINGGSNGGLLVGATLNQYPELFGAAVPQVGVMDMLRFTKFTIGWAWTSDYGSPENSEEFKALYAYSPLHNIKAGTKYPAVMVTTADHDDRVFPAHSFKYTATLQAANASDKPILIRIEVNAGHGAGKPTAKQIQETTDIYGFLVKELGMKIQ
ncbi:MAG: prolyl oligopeptidase family serine peptidase [Pyrinomonadaceae bacterium]|nr:prolyl oligopeptidase family serine peptidase [Pyrinomonadaceae bacterium]